MSFLAWLDYSSAEQDRTLNAIRLFEDRNTQDELGIGTIRDALAERLFPGTSTIQTRAKYFLLTPWIYLRHEERRTPSAEITRAARRDEVALIDALAATADPEGTIGIVARERLKRLASAVYWHGLAAWGIRLGPGSQDQYHRSLDRFYRSQSRPLAGEDGESGGERVPRNWHPQIPDPPRGFPKEASFSLTVPEATYLQERIMALAPGTLLAFLVDQGRAGETAAFPWDHPLFQSFPARVREELHHARNFSETIEGASLLYNLMLAEKKEDAGRCDDYRKRFAEWSRQITEWKAQYPLTAKDDEECIYPQYAIHEFWQQTKDQDVYITVGVGQHQMWAAQHYKFNQPRRWMSSSGLGTMGFGLPAAMGAQAAHPDKLVVDIDGDGSLLMNLQELATLHCEKLPVKVLLLNNQHLGMVVQWEDRFHNGQRAHTYLGPIDNPEAIGQGDGTLGATYPDFVTIANGFGIQARHVRKRDEYPEALAEMLAHDGPYLLDVVCPYQEHVLPMIPSGHTVRDIILE